MLPASERFQALVERQAKAGELVTWLRTFEPGPGLDAAGWINEFAPVLNAAGALPWLGGRDQAWVQLGILDFARDAFTRHRGPAELSAGAVREALGDFLNWLESLTDESLVRFCWDLLAHERGSVPEPVWWLKRSGRLHGAISYRNLALAVSVADEAEAMYWWPEQRWKVVSWERDSAPFLELMKHASYLVRAASARALGQLFYGVLAKGHSGAIPNPGSILQEIQDAESAVPGVAGPFLDGAHWSVEPVAWFSSHTGLDLRAWFVETLAGSGTEREVPHIRSLQFYAHEFFSSDPGAIRQFLKMGRAKLAVMTATENPAAIDELWSVLNEMLQSDQPAVSAAIREYLSLRTHHAGLHLMDAN